MAKLPTYALREAPMTPGLPGVSVPRSPMGEAIQDVGQGLAKFGAGLSIAGEAQEAEANKYRKFAADKAILEFKYGEQQAYDSFWKSIKPEELVGASQRYAEGYDQRVKAFIKSRPELNDLPDEDKIRYDDFFLTTKNALFGQALSQENKQAVDFAAAETDGILNSTILPKAASAAAGDPATRATVLAETERDAAFLIDARRDLSELQKAEMKRKVREQIQTAFAGGLPAADKIALVASAPAEYQPMYDAAGKKYGVDPRLLTAQGKQESGFDPTAVSPKGASGIAQMMPDTAKELGIDPTDPAQSIDGQAKYMRQLLDRYGGDERLALAAYNWGIGNVDKWVDGGSDPAKMPKETRTYIANILGGASESGLDALPYDTRLALAEDGRRELKQQETEAEKARQEEYDRRRNDLMTGILDGSAGMADVQQAQKDGWLTDYSAIKQAQDAIEKRDKDVNNVQNALRTLADPNYRFNPFAGDDRQIVDTAYEARGGGVGLLEGDAQAVSLLRGVIERSDIVPESATDTLKNGIYSRDQKTRDTAFSVLDGLYRENPQAIERAFGEQDIRRLQDYQALAPVLNPEELKARLDPTVNPAEAKARKELEGEGRKIAADIETSTVMNAFDPGLLNDYFLPLPNEPSAPLDPISSTQLRSDFDTLFAERYAVSGNEDVAKSQALDRLKMKWGPTTTGNTTRLMANPPEKYYPMVEGSHQWMADQLTELVAMKYPDAISYGLVPTVETEGAISARDLPPYQVAVIDKDGAFRLLQDKDGPALIRFDYEKAQAPVRGAFEAERARRKELREGRGQKRFNAIMDGVVSGVRERAEDFLDGLRQ